MANELTISTNLQRLAATGPKASRQVTARLTQATPRYIQGVQSVGTTEAALVTSSAITSPGMATFINNDPTNYCEIGIVVSSTFYPVLKLKPGIPQVFGISSTALYVRANTAAVDLEYLIFAN